MPRRKVVPEWSGNPRTWMRVWRARYALTQTAAAKLASVSHSTWQGWEAGTRPMPYREYQRLVALLRLTPAEIEAGRMRAAVEAELAAHPPAAEDVEIERMIYAPRRGA